MHAIFGLLGGAHCNNWCMGLLSFCVLLIFPCRCHVEKANQNNPTLANKRHKCQ